MQNLEILKKAPYMSARMYLIRQIGARFGITVEYIFGLLDYYNKKNSGNWFWQKAKFSGVLKDSFDNFNKVMDDLVKTVKSGNESDIAAKETLAETLLIDFVEKMERNLELDREADMSYVTGHIDTNLKSLIDESLKFFK